MSTGTRNAPAIPADEVPIDRFYRLSPGQYQRMIEAGILTEDDPVELLDGILIVRNPASPEPAEQLFRLSVDRYHAMIRAGILIDGDRVELLEGWLVAKMAKNPPHTIATGLLQDELTRLLPDGWYLAVQDPVTTPGSEPEPDLMVVRGSRRDYRDHQPGPRDVALVVEVADSTLSYDRNTKRRIYEQAGVSTYWVVNLVDRQVEVFVMPTGSGSSYAIRIVSDLAAEIPVILDGVEVGRVAVRDILP